MGLFGKKRVNDYAARAVPQPSRSWWWRAPAQAAVQQQQQEQVSYTETQAAAAAAAAAKRQYDAQMAEMYGMRMQPANPAAGWGLAVNRASAPVSAPSSGPRHVIPPGQEAAYAASMQAAYNQGGP